MTSTRRSKLLILAVGVAVAGCTPAVQVRSVPVMLPIPSRPVLTPIKGDALQCLAPDTYTTIVDRERALRTWGMEMEAAMQANNAKAGH